MRTTLMKKVKLDFKKSGQFYFGKNTLIKLALSREESNEYFTHSNRVSANISGQCGLLATNESQSKVKKYFDQLNFPDFANAGFVPTKTVYLEEGPTKWPISMMERFQSLGVVVNVKDSKLCVAQKFALCVEGKPLSPEQAKLLVLQDLKIGHFKPILVCFFSRTEFEQYQVPDNGPEV
eukprot:CAMPEP_0171463154 /NCGR_PEP_ID=MMETSP0945-20130129/6918_1 /TAXON_ID=109269 /ORGANISM="Vaucheria litorea, Strain CCMP2940" /LENGTH=178 /DNA_ID=CAMNT_0011989849 /DNA_START=199 /DNA_END=735 /DNA_ORIENTATION=+